MQRLFVRGLAFRPFKLALYPGDGIGVDVTRAAVRVIDAVEQKVGGFSCESEWMPWNSGTYFDEHGMCAPTDMLDILRPFDAVFLGAVGWPELRPDHVTLEPLIRMRQGFDLHACVRPARSFDGVPSPLVKAPRVDMVVVRENSEGEYVHAGGTLAAGRPEEVCVQTAIHTRRGIERALHHGFALARKRRGRLTMCTKSNAQRHGMVLWESVLDEIASLPENHGVVVDRQHIDALCMNFVIKPESFDVVVASNLFGDILTDLSGAITGSIGLNPSANINVSIAVCEEDSPPALFEPVHGSAPDIAGQGLANPTAAFLSAAMMLDHLKAPHEAGATIREAVTGSLAVGDSTRDVGGALSTDQATEAVVRRILAM